MAEPLEPGPALLPGVSAAVEEATALHAASQALEPGAGFWLVAPQLMPASMAWNRIWITSWVSLDCSDAAYVTPGELCVSTHILAPPHRSGTTPPPRS